MLVEGALPAYETLRAVEREVLWGLVDELGSPAWSATYQQRWERDRATWAAIHEALRRAAAGGRPASPRPSPPRWLATLVREHLTWMSSTWAMGAAFQPVRLLERLRLVDLDVDDTYVLALVSGLGDRWNRDDRAAALRADPELVERALWRVFEVEGGGEVSLTNVDKFSQAEASWQATFVELVGDGTLPRDRVLVECLAALQRDFSAYRAGWFAATYAVLEPTAEEQAEHQARFRQLLRSSIPATVTMAVKRLRALGKAGLLDDDETLVALGPALLAPVKGTAVEAVRLLDDVAARRADLVGGVCDAAAVALGHPHADVQRAATRLLTRRGAAGRVLDRADDLEPSVQHLVGVRPAGPQSRPDVDTPPGPVPAAPMPALAVAGDLPGRLAALLEDAADPLEVEAVLAGLASCAEPSALRPLRKRAATVLARGPREGVQAGWLRGHLARLVLVAAGEDPPELPVTDVVQTFLARRLAEVAEVLAGARPPFGTLATPDSGDGFVDPTALLDRLAATTAPPRHHDLVAALLRLGPSGRADALGACVDPGPVGAVLRHALGGPAPAGRLEGPVAWWVAAARSRRPLGTDDALTSAGLGGAGQARPLEARVALHGRPGSYEDARGTHSYTSWRWQVLVDGAVEASLADQPTAVGGHTFEGWGVPVAEDWVGWSALVWPHDAEHVLVGRVDAVLNAAASTEVSHDAVRVLDVLVRHPGRMGALAAETVAAGLAAHGRDQRARAVDAVLALVPTERLPVDALAAAMTRQAEMAVATRWAQSLRDVALASRSSHQVVVALLVAVLPELSAQHRGLHALLDLLREETLRGAGRVGDERLRAWLAGLTGSSRAARTARELLALG